MANPIRVMAAVAWALALAASLAISLVTPAGARQARESSGSREIRAVLDKQVAAWNERDLEGFMAGYLKSQELTFYSGASKTSGWEATLERYRKRYQSDGAEMGKLDFSELQIELLGPEHAFVRGRWRLKMTAGDQGGLFTLIFRKIGGSWKIVHDHSC